MVADFVEKERPAPGLLEAPEALRSGPRKRALFVSEELALQKVPRDGRHVDGDVGFGRTLAVPPDGPRHDFLAGPRLAREQHRHETVG